MKVMKRSVILILLTILLPLPSLSKTEIDCINDLVKKTEMDPNYLAKKLLQCGLVVAVGETNFLYNYKETLKQMNSGIENYEICAEVLRETAKFLKECEK